MSASTLRLALSEVVAATHGALVQGGERVFDGITTDSRKIPAGSLFVGLPGERFDGSDFAAQALAAGAAGVVVPRSRVDAVRKDAPAGSAIVAVDSTMRALGLLARWHRRRMPAKVVAVTGSNGKTTTKEMIAAILSEVGPTLATEGNLNNEIGAPLTLFGLREEHRFAVVEIGMNHEGEIGRLTAIVEPHVGVVTVASEVHIEHFGSLENIARAKGELYTGLALDAIAVANTDDPLVRARAAWADRSTWWFGRDASARVRLARVLSHDARGLRFAAAVENEEHEVTIPVVGQHNAMNACAAIAAARALDVPMDAILRGLARARPPGRRLRLSPIPGADATLLDDCYNANPASTLAALRTLAELAPEGHRIAVLGDMRELGTAEERGHREVGEAAARAGLKLLVAFGPASRHLADAATAGGLPQDRVIHTEDPGQAAERVQQRLSSGDLVLVKASRGTRLERVSDLLAPVAGGAH